MAEYIIPGLVEKFAGSPVASIELADLRFIPRKHSRHRALTAAVEREIYRRGARTGMRATDRFNGQPPRILA